MEILSDLGHNIAMAQECEIREGGGWIRIGIEGALELPRSEVKRCPECHGQLRMHRAGDGNPAHFEHRQRHKGCSLSHRFDGIRRGHPDPIE